MYNLKLALINELLEQNPVLYAQATCVILVGKFKFTTPIYWKNENV